MITRMVTRETRDDQSHEDPLDYLPRKHLQEFPRGRVIYDQQQTNEYLYLVILGRVRSSRYRG
jgi:CRP-like cAMP-binding protein